MSTPAKRLWKVVAPVVEDEHGTTHRLDLDPEELEQKLSDLAAVLRMVGGVANVGAYREEVAPGEYETTAVVIQWESFVPAQRLQQPEGDEPGDAQKPPED